MHGNAPDPLGWAPLKEGDCYRIRLRVRAFFPALPPRPESVEHRRDAIEERHPNHRLVSANVPPRLGHEQRRACLGGRACSGGESSEPIPAFATTPFGEVESHRAKRAPQLLAKVAIVRTDASHHGPKRNNGLKRDVESLKR